MLVSERRAVQGLVRAEIIRLLEQALSTNDEVLRGEAFLHALELSRSFRVRIPRRYGLMFCKKCLTPYRLEGAVRVRRGRAGLTVVVTCRACGAVRRIPLK